MGAEVIRKLRKKQFIRMNTSWVTITVVAGMLLYQFEPSLRFVLLLLIVYLVLSCLFTGLDMAGKEWRRVIWAKQLVEYEKEKLGSKWYISKWSELISKLFLIVILVLQLQFGTEILNGPITFQLIEWKYWLSFLLLFFLLRNAGLYSRNCKIDQSTKEELEDFVTSEFKIISGLAIINGVILLFLIFTSIF